MDRSDEWFAARGGQAQIIVWLIKQGKANALQDSAFDGDLQIESRCHAKHHQMRRLGGPSELLTRFQAGVPYLNDLLRERNVRSDQNICTGGSWLLLRH